MIRTNPQAEYGGITQHNIGIGRRATLAKCAELLPRLYSGTHVTFSHITALLLLGIELPRNHGMNENVLHLCTPVASRRSSVHGTQFHMWNHPDRRWTFADERYRFVSPSTAWAQMSSRLSLTELIVLGDSMMRHNPRFRRANLTDFKRFLAQNPRFRG